MNILRVALPVPLRRRFDYLLPEGHGIEQYSVGARVVVPFGRRELVGIIDEIADHSSLAISRLKPIKALLDNECLIPASLRRLCHFVADYYHAPIGEVYATALPKFLRQAKPAKISPLEEANTTPQDPLALTDEQQTAYQKVTASLNQFSCFLLEGITGSGKTEVYLQLIAFMLKNNKRCLVLVPEISLTPQTLARFRNRFSVPMAVLHSAMSDGARVSAWMAAQTGCAEIIIGTRSAIFTPIENLGLIVIDEEHDPSFKQQDSVRYSARDIAVVRARFANCPIVLGSATPALETLHNTSTGRYQLLQLTQRPAGACLPRFEVIDLRGKKCPGGLSEPLVNLISETLAKQQQVLLFINRRGYAPVWLCHECGWVANCDDCDARLTLHQASKNLQCHHCGRVYHIMKNCKSCGSEKTHSLGIGTERLEESLNLQFPDKTVVRIDRDTTRRKGSMERFLEKIHSNEADILVGTQMLAKGHHFPNVTLVAILDADSGLFHPDFRALERLGQLLLQVAGRAGRADKPGVVAIQTLNPEHQLLDLLIKHGYRPFAEAILAERQKAGLPPFQQFALFRAEAKSSDEAEHSLSHIKNLALEKFPKQILLFGPIAAPMAKRKNQYRAQLLLMSQQRMLLGEQLKQLLPELEQQKNLQKIKWTLEIDPLELV